MPFIVFISGIWRFHVNLLKNWKSWRKFQISKLKMVKHREKYSVFSNGKVFLFFWWETFSYIPTEIMWPVCFHIKKGDAISGDVLPTNTYSQIATEHTSWDATKLKNSFFLLAKNWKGWKIYLHFVQLLTGTKTREILSKNKRKDRELCHSIRRAKRTSIKEARLYHKGY